MTDKLRAAAEMALHSLKDFESDGYTVNGITLGFSHEIKALEQALAEPPNSTTHVVEPIGEVQVEQMERPFNAGKVVVHFYGEPPPVGSKLYAAPAKPDLLNQTCCECGRSGNYALYCGECWNKASQWQGLTDEEIHQVHQSVEYNRFMSPYRYAHEVIKESEAKLKEKNT